MELIDAGLPAFPDAPLKAALGTDTGRHREQNEDSVGAYVPTSREAAPVDAALVVADGVGGHEGGALASRFVVDAVRDTLGAQTGPLRGLAGWAERLLQSIHAELLSQARSRGTPASLGSTATLALIQGPALVLAHVGDSRAYRLRNGRLEQLTADDSWVAEQQRAGLLSADDPESHSRKNVLTQCLGIGAALKVQTLEQTLSAGDRYLLCSDGLHGVVTDTELCDVLIREPSPEGAAEHLINRANEEGGPDNISAVVFDVGEVPAYARMPPPAVAASSAPEPAVVPVVEPAAAASSGGTLRASTLVTGLGVVLLSVGLGSFISRPAGTAAAAGPTTPAALGTEPPTTPLPDPITEPYAPPLPPDTGPTPIPPPSDSVVPLDTLARPDTVAPRDTLARPDTLTPRDTVAPPDTLIPPAGVIR